MRTSPVAAGVFFCSGFTLKADSMIDNIGINKFKSYELANLQLASLTLLIGANASGKTNAIEAINFLSRLARGQYISDILANTQEGELAIRGIIGDIVYDGKYSPKQFPELSFTVTLDASANWRVYRTVLQVRPSPEVSGVHEEDIRQELDKGSSHLYNVRPNYSKHYDSRYHEIEVAYNDFHNTIPRPTIACSNRQAIFTQLDIPSRFTTKEAQEIIPAVVTEFQQALRNIIFLDLNPRAMVDYSFIIDHTLKPDGRNLSSVLYHICETQGRKAEVLTFIGELPEQRISDIGFLVGPRQEVMVTLTETFGNTPVTREAPLLSDGTLRVLAVAAALLSAPTGGLVVIEEIDNGVHPSRAKALLANILAASKANSLRVLLTSHNPALLDTLPKESVPDVVCCYRDPEQGDSRLVRLADLTDYPDLVARGPLGQLMTQGLLDRYLKNQRTPEQKAEQAQEWLRQLQLEDEEEAA